MGDGVTREDDPLHVCDLCDRDADVEADGLYRCDEHPLPWAELVENPAYGFGIDDGDRFIRRCWLPPTDPEYLPAPDGWEP